MSESTNNPEAYSELDRQAADWAIRLDRGLEAEEQDEYSTWLAGDPKRRDAIASFQWAWSEFDRLAGLQRSAQARVDPDLLDPGHGIPKRFRKRRQWKSIFPGFALAACATIALGYFFRMADDLESASKPSEFSELIARIERMELDDGSTIELNRGTVLKVAYTNDERRVKLLKGEAHFDVFKDASRPFIVEVAGVDVRAVGTMFNVRYTPEEVDIVVTEGIVGVKTIKGASESPNPPDFPLLEVGQRAIVNLVEDWKLEISTLTETELDSAIRWHPRLLDFDAAPLGQIVDEFNKSNPVTLIVGDPSLHELRLSSAFWSDNVEGFVRLMESSFGISAEWSGDDQIILRKTTRKTPTSQLRR